MSKPGAARNIVFVASAEVLPLHVFISGLYIKKHGKGGGTALWFKAGLNQSFFPWIFVKWFWRANCNHFVKYEELLNNALALFLYYINPVLSSTCWNRKASGWNLNFVCFACFAQLEGRTRIQLHLWRSQACHNEAVAVEKSNHAIFLGKGEYTFNRQIWINSINTKRAGNKLSVVLLVCSTIVYKYSPSFSPRWLNSTIYLLSPPHFLFLPLLWFRYENAPLLKYTLKWIVVTQVLLLYIEPIGALQGGPLISSIAYECWLTSIFSWVV